MERAEAITMIKGLPADGKGLKTEQKEAIRAIVGEFGVEGVRLTARCPNCWSDAVLVLRNFFGIATGDEPAPQVSAKWRYLRSKPMRWEGVIIDGSTPDAVIDRFVVHFPQFFERIGGEGDER